MENKNGRGIFLGVVSVATLVVAIIGATFAFFSASVTSNTGDITGNTLDISSSALSLEVTRVAITGASLTGNRQNLVPAVMTESVAGYNSAVVTNKCENAGYTGCHLYQIKVTAANAVEAADLYATLDLTPTANESSNWKFAVYQSSDPTVAGYTPNSLVGTAQSFTNDNYNFYHATTNALAQGDTYFYLIVYLLNIDASQNGGSEGGANAEDATGTYTGTITLTAAGGQVKATFSVV